MVSSNASIWFGIPGRSMQWVPAPEAGFQRNWANTNVVNQLHDGRQSITASAQTHSQFVGTYYGDYSTAANGMGIDVFHAYASGFYGSGPIAFANPYAMQQNLFAPQWASPGLARYGWTSMLAGTLSWPTLNVAAGRSVTGLTGPLTMPAYLPYISARYNHYIAIPPGYTLYLGWSGSATGTGTVMMQPYYATDNSLAPVQTLTPLSPTAAAQTNATLNGNTYNAVRIYMSRTDSSTSTITLNSMMARLYPNNTTPPATYNHVPGQGQMQLMIMGNTIAETYNYAGIKKSLTLTLEEVAF